MATRRTPPPIAKISDNLLEVKNLTVDFISASKAPVRAVEEVSFDIPRERTVALVGESGSGKSVSALAIMGLLPTQNAKVAIHSKIEYDGRSLLNLTRPEWQLIRGSRIAMIFQDPMTSLNPVLTIEQQITEPLIIHLGATKEKARVRAIELMELVGIPKAADRLKDYPHQFSGGMRQRVMIAMALSCNPQVLIADEPTTALDVTIQAQIVELVKRLRDELGMAIIWITHDLGIVAGLAKRVLVMYGGYIIEESEVKELYSHPEHPYTLGLIGSLPRLDETERQPLISIEGKPPVLYSKPQCCPFAPRCKWVMERCWNENPKLENVGPEHRVACFVDTKTGRTR